MSSELLKSHFANGIALHRLEGEHPLALAIDGQPHMVRRLSDDGSATIDFDGRAEPGQILQTTLMVACEGFDVSVPALWEVTSYVSERRQLDLKLAPVNEASHLATINTLTHAIVAGELIGTNDLLEIAKTGEADKLRPGRKAVPGAEPFRWAIQRRMGAIAFLLIAVVLVGFIAANLAGRAFVIEANGTIVSPRAVAPLMPEDAELLAYTAAPGAKVSPGSPIAIIRTKLGRLLNVTSTCDCIVGAHLAASQTFLRKDEPIAHLVPADGANRALMSVKLEELRRIRVGDQVTATFYDSDAQLVGTVERVSPPKILGTAPAHPTSFNGTIEVRFSNKLPAWRVGEPVAARVLLSRLNPFA